MSKKMKTVFSLIALVCFILANVAGEELIYEYDSEQNVIWCANIWLCLVGWAFLVPVFFVKTKHGSTTKNRRTHDPLTDQEKRVLKAALAKWKAEQKR